MPCHFSVVLWLMLGVDEVSSHAEVHEYQLGPDGRRLQIQPAQLAKSNGREARLLPQLSTSSLGESLTTLRLASREAPLSRELNSFSVTAAEAENVSIIPLNERSDDERRSHHPTPFPAPTSSASRMACIRFSSTSRAASTSPFHSKPVASPIAVASTWD